MREYTKPRTYYADVPPGRITNAIPLYAGPVNEARAAVVAVGSGK